MYSDSAAFIYLAGTIAFIMLIWNTIEVGRNDAANIVNAVFGARVLRRKTAVRIAGVMVILGAWASSPVIETARKDIFDPQSLELYDALAIFLAVYITNTVLLYSFSAFGMPVSTTAALVFSLLGGAIFLGGTVNWGTSSTVIAAIICSIFISGASSFLIQRAFRGAVGPLCDDIRQVRLHGPWIAGALMTGLVYFMLMKGMMNIGFVQSLRVITIDAYGAPVVLLVVWSILSLIIWAVIRIGGIKFQQNLFAGMAVIGMIAIAFAFGQNDLANCASPGIASYLIIQHGNLHSEFPVPSWILLLCGCLLAVGMSTDYAQRVTRAEVNTGSQGDIVRLYAPRWCLWLANYITPKTDPQEALAPEPQLTEKRKLQHYDALRAAVITSVSGSVIAFASGYGLPVSTTYVAFAAVVSTGWADKVFARGDSNIKIARTIWVIFSWFFSAFCAFLATGITALIISFLGVVGILICLAVNLTVRYYFKRASDEQEKRLQIEAAERKKLLYGQHGEQVKSATDADAEAMG
ncbi:MAG: inorganic phosphate transporter [bacterium]|jgi:phosphate/sulfate permease